MSLRARYGSSFIWKLCRGPLRQMDADEGPLEQQFRLEWAVFTSTASLGTRSVR